MEISSIRGLTEMGFAADPCFMNHWQMNSFDELGMLPMAAVLGGHINNSFSQPTINFKASMDNNNNSYSGIINNRPLKQLKPNTWGSCKIDPFLTLQEEIDPSNAAFSVVNSNLTSQNVILKPKEEETVSSKNMGVMYSQASSRNRISTSDRLSHTKDHIMAERRRREKLSERFIALSALVPGLKKTDKASVLGDAIKYVKQLQERVKTLEEQTRKKTTESVVFVKRSHLCDDGKSSSTDENSSDEPLPEIEARISDQAVLIKIHCEKRKGIMEKIMTEVEKLHLVVTNCSSVVFGNFALDITIIAHMVPDFGVSMKDLVRKLRSELN